MYCALERCNKEQTYLPVHLHPFSRGNQWALILNAQLERGQASAQCKMMLFVSVTPLCCSIRSYIESTLRCKECFHNSTALVETPTLLFLWTNTMLNNNRLERGRMNSNERNKFRAFVVFLGLFSATSLLNKVAVNGSASASLQWSTSQVAPEEGFSQH